MNNIRVRIHPRAGAERYRRCGVVLTHKWTELSVSDAEMRRFQADQMLEVEVLPVKAPPPKAPGKAPEGPETPDPKKTPNAPKTPETPDPEKPPEVPAKAAQKAPAKAPEKAGSKK